MAENPGKKRFLKVKKIGQGTYGSVTKVFDNKLQTFIAVKKLKFHEDEETIPIHALRQIVCLKELNHQNIVKMNYVTYDSIKRKLNIGFELLQQNLEQHMKRVGPMSPFTIKVFVYELLLAMRYIQNKGYMHRDLKPQNIMITKDNHVKVIDFGQCKKFIPQKFCNERHTLQISTLWYKAPQVLLGYQFYNNKIEIWSLGCIFAQMALSKSLFQSNSEIQHIFNILKLLGTPKIQKNSSIKCWKHFSPCFPKFEGKQFIIPILGKEGNDLLEKMLTIDPNKRISINEALKHNYFKGI